MMDIKKQNLLACTKRFHSLLSPLSLLQVLRLFCHRVSSLHLPHSLLCWMVRHLYCSLLPLCDSIPIYDISVDGNQVDKCIFCSDKTFLRLFCVRWFDSCTVLCSLFATASPFMTYRWMATKLMNAYDAVI